MGSNRFSRFNITDVEYKNVDGIPFKAAIFVPKNHITSGKCPLLVHWHGGGNMVGSRLYEPWTALWMLQLAESKSAIIVSPDYRLLPESNADEMLDDVVDFWSWVHCDLNREVLRVTQNTLEVDLDSIAVFGESAGGYLSIESALLCPSAKIKAVISQYGSIDPAHPHFSQPGGMRFEGMPQSIETANAIVDDYLAKYVEVPKPKISLESPVDDNEWQLVASFIWPGRFADRVGTHDRVAPMKLIEKVRKEQLPAFVLVHGNDDKVAPTELSVQFAEKLKKLHPDLPVYLTIVEGDHGFDHETPLEEPWVQETCQFLSNYWP